MFIRMLAWSFWIMCMSYNPQNPILVPKIVVFLHRTFVGPKNIHDLEAQNDAYMEPMGQIFIYSVIVVF